MNIGIAIFGAMVTICAIAGLLYISGVSHNTTSFVDTYGNTLPSQSSSISNTTETLTSAGSSGIGWLILVICVIVFCIVIFGVYVVSKILT